jgi:purine-nucleoside phosphorylase
MYDKALEAANYIKSRVIVESNIAIVLGSGLTSIVDELDDKVVIDFNDIPHFINSSVKGHSSNLIFGLLGKKKVCLLSGRLHYYEGYSMKEITFPYYVLKLLGIQNVILTNSAGGINSDLLEPGSIMTVNDFINFMPGNPLIGPNDERFGTRFPDMTEPYNVELRKIAKDVFESNNVPFIEGVYAGFQGPYYETKAEIRMMKMLGVDVVGMSTVPETILCNQLQMNVLAFSTITNLATGIQKQKHSHDNVVKIANETSAKLAQIIKDVVNKI